jgi:hypothetical protein
MHFGRETSNHQINPSCNLSCLVEHLDERSVLLWVDQMSLTFRAAHQIISSTNVSDPLGPPHEVKLFPLASVNPTTVFNLKGHTKVSDTLHLHQPDQRTPSLGKSCEIDVRSPRGLIQWK